MHAGSIPLHTFIWSARIGTLQSTSARSRLREVGRRRKRGRRTIRVICSQNGLSTMCAMAKSKAAPMPRIASVEVVDDLVLRISWSAGIRANRVDVVDLSPLINSLKFYRPLRKGPSLFRTVHLIEHGTIVAWGEDDEIEMAADSIEQLAEQRREPNPAATNSN